MPPSEYTTAASVKAYAQIASDEIGYDAAIAGLIEPVSRAIDDYCHRWFYARTMTRVYDYQEAWRLRLDRDCLTVTTLTNGDTQVLDPAHYFLYPVSGPPYRWIEINRQAGHLFQWSGTPQQCLSVAGTWGYTATAPSAITNAANIWIAYLLQLGPNSGVQSKTLGDDTTSYEQLTVNLKNPPGAARQILDRYKPVRIGSINTIMNW